MRGRRVHSGDPNIIYEWPISSAEDKMRYNNRTDVTEKEKKLRCILGHPSLQCFILSLSRTSSYPRTSLDMDVTLQEIVFFKIHIRGKSGDPI